MKKISMRMVLIVSLIAGLQFAAKAQFETQDEPPDGDPGGDPDKIPLDPGTWILVAAGAGYGIKKWIDMKQEAKQNTLKATADFEKKTKLPTIAD